MRLLRLLALLVIATISTFAHAALTLNAAGDEITDSKTGLVWKRCTEGMVWSDGTCTGVAATYTHEQALTRAAFQSGLLGWRLPNVKELASIIDYNRASPAIDVVAFPNTPGNWFWSSTPVAGTPDYAWNVFFVEGSIGNSNGLGLRVNLHSVRLVR